jgi:nicotinamidase-related amidase
MPARNPDLHGNAPDSSPVALLLVDVINDFEFDGAQKIIKPAIKAARHIAALTARARENRIPVIYANDNFGRWRSDFREVVEHCIRDDVRGRPVAQLLAPQREDYFVLKPKHSAFFATTLEKLLEYLQVRRLVLMGFAGDVCVLMTAMDAYLRDIELVVPRDCSASESSAEQAKAFAYMKRVLRADTRIGSRVTFTRPRRQKRSSGRR